ncbi:hypothetical protein BY996DRAFT_3080624 [Phakopsora pachyrhizi]|nr:hypothetical protein BY996DRAFT_3080624 [Phakopsora pachyrhizi]
MFREKTYSALCMPFSYATILQLFIIKDLTTTYSLLLLITIFTRYLLLNDSA